MVQVGMPHLLMARRGVCTCMLTQPNFSTNKSIYTCSQINVRFIWLLVKFSVYLRVNLNIKYMFLQDLLQEYKLPTNYLLKNDRLNFNNFIRYNSKIYFQLK
jgi:hypothetical protein